MAISPQIPRSGPAPFRALQGVADLERIVGDVVSGNFASFIPPGGVSGGIGGQIEATSITASEIAAGTITATNIAASTITGSLIAARTITAGNIVSSTITSNEIAANTITTGDLSANAIDGMTITGSLFRTSSTANTTGAGVVVDTLGIRGYDAAHTLKFQLDSTTGLINAQGVILAQTGSTLPINTLVGMLPAGANRYSNSAFQNGVSTFDSTGWQIISNVTSSTVTGSSAVQPVYGALSMLVTSTQAGNTYVTPSVVANDYKRVIPGLTYTASHYVYPVGTAHNIQINIQWFDAAIALISTSSGTSRTSIAGQWNRFSETFTAPAGAVYARGVHYYLSTIVGDQYYTECYQFEEGDRVSAWQPRADEILFDQINANHINVANLAAINANLGSITAGSLTAVTINSSTITGGTIQTSGSNPKVTLDSSGFYVSDASAVKHINIDTTNGLQIRAGTNSVNSIQFCDSVPGGTEVFGINVTRSGTVISNASISAYASGPSGGSTGITITDSTTIGAGCNIHAGSHGYAPTLINALNESSYVRAENKMNMRVDGGTVTCTWSSSSISNLAAITSANAFVNSAICAVTATLSGLPFGFPAVFKADWQGNNPPTWDITGYYPTGASVSGTCSGYCVILTW